MNILCILTTKLLLFNRMIINRTVSGQTIISKFPFSYVHVILLTFPSSYVNLKAVPTNSVPITGTTVKFKFFSFFLFFCFQVMFSLELQSCLLNLLIIYIRDLIDDRRDTWLLPVYRIVYHKRGSYLPSTVITKGCREVSGFLKIMWKFCTEFTTVCFHKVIYHLLTTDYTITAKHKQNKNFTRLYHCLTYMIQ